MICTRNRIFWILHDNAFDAFNDLFNIGENVHQDIMHNLYQFKPRLLYHQYVN